eukprot:gene22598-34574_t
MGAQPVLEPTRAAIAAIAQSLSSGRDGGCGGLLHEAGVGSERADGGRRGISGGGGDSCPVARAPWQEALVRVLDEEGEGVLLRTCERLIATRLYASFSVAWRVARGDPRTFCEALTARDTDFIDAVNHHASLLLHPGPLALYDSPSCGHCDAPASYLECPACSASRNGPHSLFVCSQPCFDAVWKAHK